MSKHAYLAGIIDGEGYIGVTKVQKNKSLYYTCKLSISNTDFNLMLWLVENFGGNYFATTLHSKEQKIVYIWKPHKDKLEEVLMKVLKYSVIKKTRIELMLKFRKTIIHNQGSRRWKGRTEETKRIRSDIFEQMKTLNRRGIVPVR